MISSDTPLENTPYKENELNHFKQLLENEHQKTKAKVERLRSSVKNLNHNAGDEQSSAAHHQGDIASEEDEREKLMVMIGKEDDKISEINAALDRINLGTYGICKDTGKKIQKDRLEAIPYTPYSVEASRTHEN